ncbi:hypothetical protein JHK86_012352 [Glycine max]|nr:hypothetical protein JHK86_012352 [Glycine max]
MQRRGFYNLENHLELQDDISELERKITNDSDNENLPDEPHQSLSELIEKARVTVANYAAEPTIAAQPTTALNLQPPQTSWGSSLSRLSYEPRYIAAEQLLVKYGGLSKD